MTSTVEEILRSFEALPEADKHRLVVELLRWSAKTPRPPLTDDELVATADEIFLGYDREERQRE